METAGASLMVSEVCAVATIFALQAEALRTRAIECIDRSCSANGL
jgi:hypothetical protein